jgi:hypothetical protein
VNSVDRRFLPLNGLFRPLEHIESDPKRALVYCLPQVVQRVSTYARASRMRCPFWGIGAVNTLFKRSRGAVAV